jgi:hypothetical protein
MKKPMKPSGSLQRALLSQSQLKLRPFKYEVSGRGLCLGRLYRVGSGSDEHRAEYFAAIPRQHPRPKSTRARINKRIEKR